MLLHRARLPLPLLLVVACSGPRPPEALVDLKTEHGALYGTSTEAGILVLSELVADEESLEFRYHVGNGLFDDIARVRVRGEWLSLLTPESSRPNQARFAGDGPGPDEALRIDSRDEDGDPCLLDASLLQGGRLGDFLVVEGADGKVEDLARRLAGAGVYAERNHALRLLGILNGVYLDKPAALAFIGIEEIARIASQPNSTLERPVWPRRADFEYGIPRNFAGERPAASGAGPVPARAEGSATPAGAEAGLPAASDLDALLRALDGAGGDPEGDG